MDVAAIVLASIGLAAVIALWRRLRDLHEAVAAMKERISKDAEGMARDGK